MRQKAGQLRAFDPLTPYQLDLAYYLKSDNTNIDHDSNCWKLDRSHFCAVSRSRLSEQEFRVDKWSLCRG